MGDVNLYPQRATNPKDLDAKLDLEQRDINIKRILLYLRHGAISYIKESVYLIVSKKKFNN